MEDSSEKRKKNKVYAMRFPSATTGESKNGGASATVVFGSVMF